MTNSRYVYWQGPHDTISGSRYDYITTYCDTIRIAIYCIACHVFALLRYCVSLGFFPLASRLPYEGGGSFFFHIIPVCLPIMSFWTSTDTNTACLSVYLCMYSVFLSALSVETVCLAVYLTLFTLSIVQTTFTYTTLPFSLYSSESVQWNLSSTFNPTSWGTVTKSSLMSAAHMIKVELHIIVIPMFKLRPHVKCLVSILNNKILSQQFSRHNWVLASYKLLLLSVAGDNLVSF